MRESPTSVRIDKKSNKEEIKIQPLWVQLDKEGNIQKGSAIAKLIEYYKAPTITALVTVQLETIKDEDGYLIIKAY